MEIEIQRTDWWTQYGWKRVGQTEQAASAYLLPSVKQIARVRSCYKTQGAQTELSDDLEG